MAVAQGTNASDPEFYMSTMVLLPNETGHMYNALGGNDVVYGSTYNDIIQGGTGDDTLYGNNGDDALVGQEGSDLLYGGNGVDSLWGGSADASADLLNGGAGDDFLYGGGGDDVYVHEANSGNDTINDGRAEGWLTGYGGGDDALYLTGTTYADLRLYYSADGQDLIVSNAADVADGYFNDAVVIDDFFSADTNTTVEWIHTSDNQWVDLTALLFA